MGKAARTDHKPGDILPASGVSYRVVRVLGSGGMADVYDVEDRNLGRRFVMKCMKSSIAEQKGLAERFEREARIIARLRHPNIVEVYRLDRLSGDLPLPYYLMERLDGDGLREALARKGKFELDVALGILIDVLNALDYTHEKEIVHRDLKPENVFLHRESNGLIVAKVLDFGVAKMKLAKMTGEGGFIGTYKYAAPEQHQNDAEHPVTHKADIFAVGLMGFEMLTGQHPFAEHGRGVQLVRAILETDAPPLPPGLPREVVAVFRAALCRDAARRPDAFEFLAVLKRAKDAVVPSHAERSVHEHSTVEEITRGQPGSEPPRPMTLADVASPTEPDKPLAYAKTAPLHVEAPAAAALLGGATVETQMRFDADGNMVSADPSSGSAPTPGQTSPTNLPAPRSPRPPHFETSEQQQVQYLRDEPRAPPAASSEPESWRVIQQAASLLEEKPVPGPPNTSLRVSSQPVQKALTPSRASTPVPKRVRRKPLQQRVRTALARMPRHVAQRWTIAAVVTAAGLAALVATWAVHASRDAGNDRPRSVDHATVVTEGSKP